MMFRVRAGKIRDRVLCVRTTYDPAAGRGVQRVVASFCPHADKVPSDVAELLTFEEREQAERWIDGRQAERRRIMLPTRWQHIRECADQMSSALEDDELAPLALKGLDTAALYASLDRLTRALRKRGHQRPAAKVAPLPSSPTPLEAAIQGVQRED